MMKKIIIILVSILIGSCMQHFNYSVQLRNKTAHKILFEPVQIADHPQEGVFSCSELLSGGSASMGPYYQKPLPQAILSWTDFETKETKKYKVVIKSPPEFAKIIFTIESDGSANVLYRVWDEQNQDYVTVNEDGKKINY